MDMPKATMNDTVSEHKDEAISEHKDEAVGEPVSELLCSICVGHNGTLSLMIHLGCHVQVWAPMHIASMTDFNNEELTLSMMFIDMWL